MGVNSQVRSCRRPTKLRGLEDRGWLTVTVYKLALDTSPRVGPLYLVTVIGMFQN